jgi:hypothetical protein
MCGHPLLNLSQGGLGPMGIEWTTEMREAARLRSTGRKGVSRFAEDNPFYGRSHGASQRAKWSKLRKGRNVGPDNPNYGKIGENHPSFGRVMSQEAREALAEQRRGVRNPNYGRTASDETRAKMSAVRKGRPMPSSRRSAHTRYHTNRGLRKDTCRTALKIRHAKPHRDRWQTFRAAWWVSGCRRWLYDVQSSCVRRACRRKADQTLMGGEDADQIGGAQRVWSSQVSDRAGVWCLTWSEFPGLRCRTPGPSPR